MTTRRPAAGRSTRKRRGSNADWVFHADDAAVLEALAHGRHGASLREYFGAAGYEELARLASLAAGVDCRRGPKIIIVPGIMGSTLGEAGHAHAASRVLWLDPVRIAAGDLRGLRLPGGGALRPLGVLLFSYAKLLLHLRIQGLAAAFYPYDWRLGLDELGAALAAHLADGGDAVLVAHSMGGLVARMAMARSPKRAVRKLIMLGTPNLGSYSPVQAIRGTYPFVRQVAMLDLEHSPEFLARTVFRTFPGLYQLLPARRLLPARQRAGRIDVLAAANWPAGDIKPDAALLARVAAVRARLAPADARMVQVVGVNRETIVNVRRHASGFEYDMAMNGDGTVPRTMAALPGLETYFVEESHADLANNPRVIRAVIDLIRRGRTRELPRRWAPRRAPARRIDDAALRAGDGPKVDWRRLDSAQRAAILAGLNS